MRLVKSGYNGVEAYLYPKINFILNGWEDILCWKMVERISMVDCHRCIVTGVGKFTFHSGNWPLSSWT